MTSFKKKSDPLPELDFIHLDFLTDFFRGFESSFSFSLFDSEGKYVYISPLFAQFLGEKNSHLLGFEIERLGTEKETSKFWDELKKSLNSGTIWNGEVFRKHKNGNQLCTYTTIVPLNSVLEFGKLYLELHQDITQYDHLKWEIEQQKQVILMSARFNLIGQILGGVTHEINNTLTIILGTAKYFKLSAEKGELNLDSISKGSDKIMGAALRIAKTLKIVKTFMRQTAVDSERFFSVQNLFSDLNLFIGARIKNHGIHFEIQELKNDCLVEGRGDEISFALLNLIMNSDSAVNGTQEPWIKVNCEQHDGWIVFQIIDSRQEISENIKKSMVNPLMKTEPDVDFNLKLSFSVIQDIIKRHCGQFYVESGTVGTIFSLRIPIRK